MTYKELEVIIDNLYERSIIDYESNQESRKNIHVSDIVGDCMRKPWYRLHGYKQEPKDFKKALPLVHGTMLHECVDLKGKHHEIKMAANIKSMDKVLYTNNPRPDKYMFDTVQGSMDDMIEIDDELIIIDKKTTKVMPRTVSKQYQTQMNIYKLLYYVNYNVDIKKAAIIYIDKTTAWLKHKTIVFDLLDVLEIQPYILEKLEQIGQETPPDRTESFLCNWCPHIKECNPNVHRI